MAGSVIPVVTIPVTATFAAESAVSGDLTTALLQLGIGGILVLFGATIYRRFEGRADEATTAHKLEMKEQADAYEARIRDIEAKHEETRRLYIEALKNSKPALPSKD